MRTEDIKTAAKEMGASFVGVADLEPAAEFIENQGGATIAGYPTGVSIGVALPAEIVDALADKSDRVAVMSYQHHGYSVINQRLDAIATRITSLLQDSGARAFPVAASQTIDRENHLGAISNKLVARLAGLGWIGKSCLLVTPQVGPRVRWASILTDADLSDTGPVIKDRCGTCTECVDICPVHAFTGKAFDEGDDRSERFDVSLCAAHQSRQYEAIGDSLCGLCLYVCPFGRTGTHG